MQEQEKAGFCIQNLYNLEGDLDQRQQALCMVQVHAESLQVLI